MAPRLDLQTLLEDLLGSRNVYFQPPPSIQIEYPCIVYNRENIQIEHADNEPYSTKTRYQIMVIDRDPDSSIPVKVAKLATCSYDRFYVVDNLNHDVFRIYF